VTVRAGRAGGGADELADEEHSASADHNTFRQIGGTPGVAALGTIVAAGHHTAAAAGPAAFQAGLGHAFTAVAALLALCAITVAILARNKTAKRTHGRHSARADRAAGNATALTQASHPHGVMTSERDGRDG
jgi:hypothetical protein